MQWTIIDGIISGEAEELARSLLLLCPIAAKRLWTLPICTFCLRRGRVFNEIFRRVARTLFVKTECERRDRRIVCVSSLNVEQG